MHFVAPSQGLAETALQPVPSSSPSSPLVLPSVALSERPRDPAPPECPLEVVEFPKNFLGGSFPPLLTETPNPPGPMESPDSSWLPEALDLPWPPKLPASVLETICALSASCVSVSSRSQSLPGVSSTPPWWASLSSAPPWWASVSSAPPWWASVSSAPPWWASVSSAPPWWAPDLPESPPLTCQSHLTPPLTCQSHLTPPLSCPPCPGGLLSHWLHIDLALRSLPRFHLRFTALLDYALCEASGSRSLGGGGCHQSLINPDCLTTPAPHSHTHISSTLPYKHCEVLFLPWLTFLSVIHPAICYLCV